MVEELIFRFLFKVVGGMKRPSQPFRWMTMAAVADPLLNSTVLYFTMDRLWF